MGCNTNDLSYLGIGLSRRRDDVPGGGAGAPPGILPVAGRSEPV